MDKLTYKEQALEKYITLFKWQSDSLKLPFNPEFWLTTNGSIGYLIDRDLWVVGTFNGITDKYGDFKEYVWHSLDTQNVKTGTAENHSEIIVCGNTPLYRPFEKERDWFAYIKSEIDKSIDVLNTNTRKSKAYIVENDRKKRELERTLKAIDEGKPGIFTTSMLEELETVDLTDPADIERMQYLNSFFQAIEKRENNFAGIDLDIIDKRAQVSNNEIKQYDDVTTQQYLILFESRQRFVEEMAKNGINLSITRSPIYFDEPTEKDVNTGEFEAQEAQEENPAPEQEETNNEENNQTD